MCSQPFLPLSALRGLFPDVRFLTAQGYANYKFFLQFLLYTARWVVYIAGVCFYSLVNYTSNEPAGYEMAPISWALAALLGIIFGSATGCSACTICTWRQTIVRSARTFFVIP